MVSEELSAESVRQIGVTNLGGGYSSTHVLDGVFHNFDVITQGGYTEYVFTTSLKDFRIDSLVYDVKYDTAHYVDPPGVVPPYLAVSHVHIQAYNWRTFQWDTVLSGGPLASDPAFTLTIPSSRDYVSSATGLIRLRYYRAPSYLLFVHVHVDFQKLTVYADETRVSDSPCIDLDIMKATGRQRIGLSESGSYAATFVSDRSFHRSSIGDNRGYVLYEFESSVRTANPVAEGVTSLSEGYAATHVSDDSMYSRTFAPLLGSGTHNYVVEFHTDATPGLVRKIEYVSEWDSCKYVCHWGCSWYCYAMRAYIWNWDTGAWNTMWSSGGGQFEAVSTWTSTSGDYVGPDGLVRVLQQTGSSWKFAPLRIDYQHVRIWEENPSPGSDELRVLIYEPEFYTDCENVKNTQMSIFNWRSLDWEGVLSSGPCYHAFYFHWTDDSGDPEDYVSGDGVVWVRYLRSGYLVIPVNVDFQEVSLLQDGTPPLPPTTTSTTTTTSTSTTTTSSTTTTISKSVTFSFRASDDNYIDHCDLKADITGSYVIYHTFYEVVNGMVYHFTIDSIPVGVYHWMVLCFDDLGQMGVGGPWEFSVSDSPVVPTTSTTTPSSTSSTAVSATSSTSTTIAPTTTVTTTMSTTTTAFVFSLPFCDVEAAVNLCPSYTLDAGALPSSHCSSGMDCGAFEHCTSGLCCDDIFACVSDGRCYDRGDIASVGGKDRQCHHGEWEVYYCQPCTSSDECVFASCTDGYCPVHAVGCFYDGGYYDDGGIDLPGGCSFDMECFTDRWVKGECMPCTAGEELSPGLLCNNGFACPPGQCGYDCGCYSIGSVVKISGIGYVCDLGDWSKVEGMPCSTDDECFFIPHCSNGHCCEMFDCWYGYRCYEHGESPAGYSYTCSFGEWV